MISEIKIWYFFQAAFRDLTYGPKLTQLASSWQPGADPVMHQAPMLEMSLAAEQLAHFWIFSHGHFWGPQKLKIFKLLRPAISKKTGASFAKAGCEAMEGMSAACDRSRCHWQASAASWRQSRSAASWKWKVNMSANNISDLFFLEVPFW